MEARDSDYSVALTGIDFRLVKGKTSWPLPKGIASASSVESWTNVNGPFNGSPKNDGNNTYWQANTNEKPQCIQYEFDNPVEIVELADDINAEKEIHPQNYNLDKDDFESRLSKLGKKINEE